MRLIPAAGSPPILARMSAVRGWVWEAAIGTACAAVLVGVSSHVPPGPGIHPLDAFGYLLVVASGVALGVCRRWPRTVAVLLTATLCVFVARPYPNGPVWVTAWIALAVVGWRTDRRTAVAGVVVMIGALSVAAAVVGRSGLVEPAIYLGWSVAAVFLGDALRSRRTYLAGLAERARFLEHSREEEAARRVAEERLRIARDLHDSVAHAMVTINVQAGAAAHVLARRPEVAGQALAAIQRASGEVLDELTAMLSVLRDGTERAERAPTPGLADIPRLVDTTAAAGLRVTVALDESAPAVAAGAGTAAYRLVQESLTNVLRHSQARTAQVRVRGGPDGGLCVEVTDPGPARPADTTRTRVGILGMRERVTATGGDFQAGPTPDGGFAVRAAWEARG